MEQYQNLDPAILARAGLNRQAVFDIDDLPGEVVRQIGEACPPGAAFRQLILIGHAGRKLWQAVTEAGMDTDNPIDDFTVRTVEQWFAACQPRNRYAILYPGEIAIGLQRLGRLAGWHHPSPFMIGIDREWGTWYAYRAVLLADTRFAPTRPQASRSPCAECGHRLCIAACPAAAMAGGGFDLAKCAAYRRAEGSSCRHTCLARVSCPVGSEHRYGEEQIRHTYSISLKFIERYG